MTAAPRHGLDAPARPIRTAADAPTLPADVARGRDSETLIIWSLAIVTAAAGVALVGVSMTVGLSLTLVAVAAVAVSTAVRLERRRIARRLGALADRAGALGHVGGPGEPPSPDRPARAADGFSAVEHALSGRDLDLQARLVRLLESRAMLRAIIDGIDAPVFATGDDGTVLLCNRAGERLMHRRGGRLAGSQLDDLFSSTKLLGLAEKARLGTAVREDIELTFDLKPRIFEVAAVPARMAIEDLPARSIPRAAVVLTLRDVTDLVQTERLKTDFVANASHELRTPIASIRAAVETLRGAPDDDHDLRGRLTNMIEGNVLRLEEMVADLLDLSQLESASQPPQRRPLPFSDVAEAMAALFETARNRRGVGLVFETGPTLERLETDAKLLHLILRNLIDNAIKFAHEGTDVRVIAETADIKPRPAEPTGDRDAPAAGSAVAGSDGPELDPPTHTGLRLRVIDRGEGIPLKHQTRVFERFFQVDGSRQRAGSRRGTGLGLAIVKHATRRLGGDIRVESVYQEGTTMTVEIPGCVRLDRPVAAAEREGPGGGEM